MTLCTVAVVVASNAETLSEGEGLNLTAEIAKAKTAQVPEISIQVENSTDKPAPFEVAGGFYGFSFKLFDGKGNEIQPQETWRRLNTPNEWVETLAGRSFIKPKERLFYALKLDEAFGPAWLSGKDLKIEWSPHNRVETEQEPSFTISHGLKGSFDITPLVALIDPEAAARNAATGSPSPLPAPPKLQPTAEKLPGPSHKAKPSEGAEKMAEPIFSRRTLFVGLTLGGILLISIIWVVAGQRSSRGL